MIRVTCPTGCSIPSVVIPFGLRHELIRCRNCTAWYKIPDKIEDASLCEGVLVAAPGERPAAQRRSRAAWRIPAGVALGLAAGAVGIFTAAAAGRHLALAGSQIATIWALAGAAALVPVAAGAAVGRVTGSMRRIPAGLVGAATGVGGTVWLGHSFSAWWLLALSGVAGALLALAGSALSSRRVRV